MGHNSDLTRGLREQQYIISRDLHCWDADLSYDVKKGAGMSLFVVFKLKAFPENEFKFNQSYHEAKSGSQ